MSKNTQFYKVDFSISDMTLAEQDKFYRKLINLLNDKQRYNLSIKITDCLGGQHFIWDKAGTGVDPNGVSCRVCHMIDCEECVTFQMREKNKNAKNTDNAGKNSRD